MAKKLLNELELYASVLVVAYLSKLTH